MKRGVGGGPVPYASLEDEPLTLAGLRSSVLSHEVGEVGSARRAEVGGGLLGAISGSELLTLPT